MWDLPTLNTKNIEAEIDAALRRLTAMEQEARNSFFEVKIYLGFDSVFENNLEIWKDQVIRVTQDLLPDGATVTFGTGMWEGITEPQATITVITKHPQNLVGVVEVLKFKFGQEMVLLTSSKISKIEV